MLTLHNQLQFKSVLGGTGDCYSILQRAHFVITPVHHL